MKTRAAVLWEANQPWQIEDIELGEPRSGEVLVRVEAAGLCHSEDHHATGDVPFVAPMVGGHEGAGVVERVGDGVTLVAPGDHVVFSSIPSCGRCPSCAVGQHNLCDLGEFIAEGRQLLDHTARHRVRGTDLNINCFIGSYAEHTVVNEMSIIRIDDDIPFDRACIVGCGVPTGWGSMVYAGGVRADDDVAVVGIGGLGAAALQGARMAGARHVFAVEPVEWKRKKALDFGATHVAENLTSAAELISEITWGRMCSAVVMTMGVGRGELMTDAVALAGKRGRIVVTNIHRAAETTISLNMLDVTRFEKQIVGSIFGSVNSRRDIPRLLSDYRRGALDLDAMITSRYRLDQVNEGYADLRAGKNIRGVLQVGAA